MKHHLPSVVCVCGGLGFRTVHCRSRFCAGESRCRAGAPIGGITPRAAPLARSIAYFSCSGSGHCAGGCREGALTARRRRSSLARLASLSGHGSLPILVTTVPVAARVVTAPTASTDVMERLLDAITALNPVRPSHHFVSDSYVNVWFEKVDRACVGNRWDDNECLPRIGNCFRGKARSWFSQWVHNIRTWSNTSVSISDIDDDR